MDRDPITLSNHYLKGRPYATVRNLQVLTDRDPITVHMAATQTHPQTPLTHPPFFQILIISACTQHTPIALPITHPTLQETVKNCTPYAWLYGVTVSHLH